MPDTHLTYLPFDEVGAVPNVIVDGTPTTATRLTLSHWPGSPPVPTDVEADLSAQMAFRYLDHAEDLHGDATAVSNNHFDQDGLVGVFALVDPDAARARRGRLEDLAAAGDFATYRDRDAARASMVISAADDPARSPFGDLPVEFGPRVAALFTELLPRLPELVDHVDRFAATWADEDAVLAECEAAIADGSVTIEQHPEVDLALVTIPSPGRWWGHRFFGRRYDGFHPMALHNATDRGALLVVGDSYRFTYRYESWVQFRSRAIRPRIDLVPVAEELTAADDVAWSADAVDGLTPELRPDDGASSALPVATVLEVLTRHLRDDPVAFDPFTRRGD